ncbi:MAG: cytochrome b/b6 domain-containing protein [Candidatus Zixiibacteriota bacterium]
MLNNLKSIHINILCYVFLLFGLSITSGYAIDNKDCLECHEDGANNDKLSYGDALRASIHEGLNCVDCHQAIEELPHEEIVPKVDCGMCHDKASEIYKKHGRLEVGKGDDIPDCHDCHGKHDILAVENKNSRVNPLNLPKTCGRCHEDLDLTTKHEILYGKAVKLYESSVHGKAALGGVYVAATCNDCHSTGGTAHRILGPGATESSINHFNIPSTCGKCHQNIENDYWEGIHGKLVRRGETDAPVCTDCHGEHGIISAGDPHSRVSPSRVAEATCSPCHESARLNEKYGIPTGRLQTYIDSYHGLKSMAGDLSVANCSSCHGAHRILPHTDSTSSIYADNLQRTCGICHPGISSVMAKTPIHGTPGITQTPIASIVQKIYVLAIIIIIGLMVLHWILHLRKQIKNVSMGQQVRRMTLNEMWQHLFLTATFMTLVITGFALRFSDAWWANFIFGHEGGFPLRGIIHRVSAVLFILVSVWHIIYLFTQRGRQFLRDMMPGFIDFGQFIQMNSYNLGINKSKPIFGRFSYVEKAEYWALVWGTIIMIISGFFLWFDNFAVLWFPKGFLDVMLVIHYYEAWLATLAIAIWHLYSTVFNPEVYPMNPSWLTGKMPLHMYQDEHPNDPALKEFEHAETQVKNLQPEKERPKDKKDTGE